MSWLFSQALVEEYSAAICSDGELSAPSNGNPSQQAYCAPDKMTAFSRLSRFGMMFKPLTEDRGEELLTSFLAGFRAKTSAQRGGGQESKDRAPACGSTWPASSARFCLDSSSWKTAHCLWEEVLPWSSVTLPRWGMTRSGHVLAHPTAERPISVTASGLWPTPNVPNGGRSLTHVTDWRGKTAYHNGKKVQVGLEHAAKHWPTPVTSMAKGSSPGALTRKDGQDRRNDRLDHAVMASDGGLLNPTWVEWLMGWPLGWTDLKPLAMDKFREWQQQHSQYWQDNKEAA